MPLHLFVHQVVFPGRQSLKRQQLWLRLLIYMYDWLLAAYVKIVGGHAFCLLGSLVPNAWQPRQEEEKRVKSYTLTFLSIDKVNALFQVHWSDSVFGPSVKAISLILSKSEGIKSSSRTFPKYIEFWSLFAECPLDSHRHLRFNCPNWSVLFAVPWLRNCHCPQSWWFILLSTSKQFPMTSVLNLLYPFFPVGNHNPLL